MWSISSFVNIVWIRDNSWFYLPEIIFLRKTAFQDFDPQILGVKFKYFLLNLFLINQENSVFSINNLIFSWTDIFLNSNIFLDSKVTYSPLPDITESARYILVLFIKNLANPRSYNFVTIATNGITSGQIFPLCWQVVSILEITCGTKVITCVADSAKPNKKFVRIHKVSIF